jgi:hypothetical protein
LERIYLNLGLLGPVAKAIQQLVLNKGTEKFVFRYQSGCEDKLLDALIEQAKDKRTSFDWFDAAVLSFKLTQSLVCQADELLHKGINTQNSEI